MLRGFCASTRWSWFVAVSTLVALSSGCARSSSTDDVVLKCPDGWTKLTSPRVDVPGRVIEAWKGPNDAMLVVFRSLPVPGPNPEALSHELANRLEHLPGLQIVRRDVKRVHGRLAAWVEVVAPGDGRSLAPSGTGVPRGDDRQLLIPTHQLLVGLPREADTLWLRWSYPESAEKTLRPQIVDTLEGLELRDRPLKLQRY